MLDSAFKDKAGKQVPNDVSEQSCRMRSRSEKYTRRLIPKLIRGGRWMGRSVRRWTSIRLRHAESEAREIVKDIHNVPASGDPTTQSIYLAKGFLSADSLQSDLLDA
jgi:hypothetical protein